MSTFKIVLVAVLAVLVVIVVLQNTQPVETKLLFVTISMPNAAMLFLTFAAGVVVGMLGPWRWFRRKKRD